MQATALPSSHDGRRRRPSALSRCKAGARTSVIRVHQQFRDTQTCRPIQTLHCVSFSSILIAFALSEITLVAAPVRCCYLRCASSLSTMRPSDVEHALPLHIACLPSSSALAVSRRAPVAPFQTFAGTDASLPQTGPREAFPDSIG